MGNRKHIIFLQSAHTRHDERVCFHQANILKQEGHHVDIYDIDDFDTFTLKEADIYLVDTPKALWKVRKTKAKIIYDITEWCPSKKNLHYVKFGKITKFILLIILNIWAGYRTDAFIFGEEDKAIPFRYLFSKKPFIFLSYYPDLRYIEPQPIRNIQLECHILYAGALNQEKGWDNVLASMQSVALQNPETRFYLDVITQDTWLKSSIPSNLNINILPIIPFEDFCKKITTYDLFLDLRKIDCENNRCLPIKLFYYMACGRPSVYANLNAISKGVKEIQECVKLVNTSLQAADAITNYINNNQLYLSHCHRARQLSEEKYNWENIKHLLIQLINDL